jgi:hypothetical protein
VVLLLLLQMLLQMPTVWQQNVSGHHTVRVMIAVAISLRVEQGNAVATPHA